MGRFGQDCAETCDCAQGARCFPANGACLCEHGFTGDRCTERLCPDGLYGLSCQEPCTCDPEHSLRCAAGARSRLGRQWERTWVLKPRRPARGRDRCHRRGREGPRGGRGGALGTVPRFGEAPRPPRRGAGEPGERARTPSDGAARSRRSCHPMSGECSCLPGWAGLHCNESCPQDTHGPGCQEHCLCLHGGACQPDSGLCRCAPGYTVRRGAARTRGGEAEGPGRPLTVPRLQGPHCASLCPPDTYGVDCKARCSCDHAIACSPVDGACVCKEGNGAGPPGRGGLGAGPRGKGGPKGGGGPRAGRSPQAAAGRWESSQATSFLENPLCFSSATEILLVLKGPGQKARLGRASLALSHLEPRTGRARKGF